MEQGGAEVSLLKAIGWGVFDFVLRTVLAVFVGAILVVFATLPVRLAGAEDGSTPVVVVAAVVVGATVLVCWAASIIETYYAIKERPRGLGLRRVKKWKDHVPYYDWEKY